MPRYQVDVKAFVVVTVEAADEAEARRIADSRVDGLELGDIGTFGVDGDSDVELVEDETGS